MIPECHKRRDLSIVRIILILPGAPGSWGTVPIVPRCQARFQSCPTNDPRRPPLRWILFCASRKCVRDVELNERGPALARHEPDGGSAAFAAIVEEHWTAVYRTLYTLCGNAHDTEDLTQQTFLRAVNPLTSFRPGTRMRAWLLRIATNAFFDAQRKRRRARVKPLESDPPAAATSPGHALEVAEASALLKAALEELSETTRLVFHLPATEDLSFREIAD